MADNKEIKTLIDDNDDNFDIIIEYLKMIIERLDKLLKQDK